MHFEWSEDFARSLDSKDELASFQNEFEYPELNGRKAIYYTGNSLGLMPKKARAAVENELHKWSTQAVEGHFTGEDQWFNIHKRAKKGFAYMMGAKEDEVVLMNTLTTNLHLLMVSFFQPNGRKTKIVIEGKAFPSDQYVVESQLKFHGLNPSENLIELQATDASGYISTESILETIENNHEEIALLMLSGINYYTGQRFDMKTITQKAKEYGITVGWDLAHAAGNVELELHDWGVDFASWCTYKYMNSGPGAPSGVFVHEQHAKNNNLPRFAGWWGYDQETRFMMGPGFKPMYGADGWQQSNGPAIAMCTVDTSLELFMSATREKLFSKRDQLTAYLEWLIEQIIMKYDLKQVAVITPSNKNERGSQLSVEFLGEGKKLFNYLMEHSILVDWREPGVIRFAPVPLYNSFLDVWKTAQVLATYFEQR